MMTMLQPWWAVEHPHKLETPQPLSVKHTLSELLFTPSPKWSVQYFPALNPFKTPKVSDSF